jgi:hypothetical protein
MTTLVDRLVSDELWAIVEPLLRPHPAHPTAADTAPSLLATALPQSSTWRALLPGGGCCPPRNWGAGRRRPPDVALPSGPGRACSRPCTWTFSTGWVSRAGWTGRAPAWTRPACAPSAGDHVGATPVDRGKPGSKMQLVCQGSGLPLTAAVTAANIADVTMLAAMVDDIAPCAHSPVGRATGPASWMRTRAMTVPPTVPGYAVVGSGCGSLGVGSSRRSGSAATAGGSNGRCRG